MRRLGSYKDASHAEALAQHRALPLAERLARSWALYLAGRGQVADERRDDDPSRFYELARRRGLYRP